MECCIDMETMIEDESIEKYKNYYIMYGKPDFVDDGDGYTDDMTDRMVIDFCPFCGAKLKVMNKALDKIFE